MNETRKAREGVEVSWVDNTVMRSQRARRISMNVPLRYREDSRKEWLEGRIENISNSGVLFRAPEALNPDTSLEFTYVLPIEHGGGNGATVHCGGQTVRTILPSGTAETSSVAVKILHYRLKHES